MGFVGKGGKQMTTDSAVRSSSVGMPASRAGTGMALTGLPVLAVSPSHGRRRIDSGALIGPAGSRPASALTQ